MAAPGETGSSFAAATFFASEAGKVFGPDGVDWAKAAGVYLWPSVVVTRYKTPGAVVMRS